MFGIFQNLNLFELSRRLANATANRLSGRNLGLAVDLFGQLVRREIGPNGPNLAESARNVGFSRDLCRIGDTLLSAVKGNAELHQQIMNILAIYGTFLAQLHREQSFLRPFQMGGRNLGLAERDFVLAKFVGFSVFHRCDPDTIKGPDCSDHFAKKRSIFTFLASPKGPFHPIKL